ncbi:patatin-domain-containing protein [Cryphonectria parasitica EP155]|uniref:Patatin-like phospholipase domain-containing protein n=1 Tax=Cryphonectria parasitica (strain ATCC 38755 / EP155) TaxID=660469 RepID=A0A9P5CLN8_CRYP1|nr:patatin-domain-containing protein [Cryphonectria parasitica EP155]KAF3762216.1 patatin-domain-containing protein [Cryphonectria parasitica EP155]
MTDCLQILPSLNLGQTTPAAPPSAELNDDPKKTASKESRATGSLPVQTLSRLVREANRLLSPRKNGQAGSKHEEARGLEERKQILGLRMKNATSASQWSAAAQELDLLEGNNIWKSELGGVDGIYRPDFIRARMRDLDDARTSCDIHRMLHLVRTALSRDLGGMGNIDLYRHSYVGTKDLIEQYVQSAVKTIEDLVEKSGYPGVLPDDLDHKDILGALVQARQSFGRSALLLSGGGTFGMMHAGVLKAMFEADVLPRIISGASAGSIVCAVFCTRTRDEVPGVIEAFPYGDLAVFGEEGKQESVLDHVKRLFTEGSWSDIKHLKRVMRGMLGDMTFQEAYNRTRKICNISVSTESIYELPRLLNYITAPNVMIWSAVAASCSVPFIFSGAHLLVKDPQTGEHMPWNPTPQKWVDGSVDNDLPMTRLAEMFNVNHFIVSQVNPHVVPFLAKDDRLFSEHDGSRAEFFGTSHNASFTATLTRLAKDEALHRLHFLAELGIIPTAVTKLRSVLSQKYSGDITILPEHNVNDLPRILKNPTVDFMERATLSGERATWPKLSRIRDRCAVELAIDRSIQTLRARCLFSQSQVNLRRLVTDAKNLGPRTTFAHGLYMHGLPQSAHAQTQSLADHARLQKRSRRASGSSLQLLSKHPKQLLDMEDDITDDDTEVEERLELGLRRSGTNTSLPSRSSLSNRPRFRKGSLKGLQPVVLSNIGPLTNPFPAGTSGDDHSEFDFSKPLKPPSKPTIHSATAAARASTEEFHLKESPVVFSRSSPQPNSTPPSRLEFTSPTTGDLDTSDLHTSDSHTDDSISDLDPYSQLSLVDEGAAPSKANQSDGLPYDVAVADGRSRANSPSAAALADDEQDTTDPGEGMSD